MGMSLLQGRSVSRRRQSSRETGRDHFLRLVTYNVHSCIGLDGRLSPTRIARVLAALDPDVVALQELDVCRQRSGCVDQAQEIAQALTMELHFLPCIEQTGEKYGNAVLSRLPMRLIRAERLPQLHEYREPRGALWVQIDGAAGPLDLITTHLGLDPRERIEQIEWLLGPQWLGSPECAGPQVLCGDFNAGPRSSVYRRAARRLRDVQTLMPGSVPARTWFAPWPLARIDHIFVNPGVAVTSVEVGSSRLSRVASDHLPLVADLVLQSAAATAIDDACIAARG
jgi:endonuclease/exonuclease/phosphatase family metal-dependent hydrolase